MIDIIVPVYDGVEETRRCLESVLRTVPRERAEVVVVDDATPRPEIAADLDRLAAEGKVTLLRHGANRGFVASANEGMALHPDRDVVLLNSDTEVANDWLGRLAAAARGERVATATPFSNNATICSYPFEGWSGGVPGSLGLERLDAAVASANRGRAIDIPTAVGFCMFIRRACLDAVGAFDAERFGRGYGEENDFCMRAAKAGWRHVLAGDVFVFHRGAVSFAESRAPQLERSAAALLEAHPEYGRIVQEFVARDPAAGLRQAIDDARSALGGEEAGEVARERMLERAILVERVRQLNEFLAQRDERLARLDQGLARATQIVAERSRELAAREAALQERDAEIARLHVALANAEALAFGRAGELERIRNFWLWRFYWRAMRWGAAPAGKDG